jgi:D-glycero-D-manno-heptose 1,7-bisphosphate phosphatase
MNLIILDRDGVINYDSDAFIKTPDEWSPIPGSLEAIAQLNAANIKVAVASNQSGIGRGLITPEALTAIHQKMFSALKDVRGHIDYLVFCPHLPEANCACRKPKPGLLQNIAEYFNYSLTNVPVIGDAWRDLQAAQAVNAQPILVLTGKGKSTRQNHAADLNHISVYPNLATAVAEILSNRRGDE